MNNNLNSNSKICKNSKRSIYISNIAVVILLLYTYFSNIIVIPEIIWFLVPFIFLLYLGLKNGIVITKYWIAWIVLLIYTMFSSLMIGDIKYLSFSLSKLLLVSIMVLLTSSVIWISKFNKYSLAFSTIHLVITIFSVIMTNMFEKIFYLFLSGDQINITNAFISQGVYSGISGQVGRNAFYFIIGIAILIGNIVESKIKNSKLQWLGVIVFIIGIILTGKRGFLIAVIISILVCLLYNVAIRNKSIMYNIIKYVIVSIVISFIILRFIPQASVIINKFLSINGGDITSGRSELYTTAWNMFIENPIFGGGTGAFWNISGMSVHNVYLQILAENGVVGFLVFIFAVIINLKLNFKMIKFTNKYQSSITVEEKNILNSNLFLQIFFVIYCITGNPFYDNLFFVIYMLSITVTIVVKNKVEFKDEEKVCV